MKIGYVTNAQGLQPGRGSLVFIHGAGGQGRGWQGLLSPLGRRFNALALDLPGHGQTPPPASDTVMGYATWLKQALDQLRAEFDLGPLILGGHSMGGAITQTYALTWPEDLAGLILVGTGYRLRVAPQILEGVRRDFPAAAKLIIDWSFAPADQGLKDLSLQIMLQAGSEVVHGDFTACDRFDSSEQVGRIGLPCLILTGEDDRMTPPKYAQALRDKIAGSEMHLIPGAGHMLQAEKPGRMVELIEPFAQRVLGRAAG